MNGRPWTPAATQELREIYPHLRCDVVARILGRSVASITGRAGLLGLHKTPEYLASPEAYRFRRDYRPGIPYRYKKGNVPANKGTRRPGFFAGRMRDGWFRKGQLSHNSMPLFAERVIDGYLYRKIAEVKRVPYMVNWKVVHVLNWEQANGRPVPEGHCLAFRDRNRLNVEISNLELITRQERMRRNTLHRYPPRIKRVIVARGALNRKLNRLERERAQQNA